MSQVRVPFLSILAVPCAAVVVAIIGLATQESQWRDAALGSRAAGLDLSTACALVNGQDEICSIRTALIWIVPLAVATVLIAFAVAGLISFAVSAGKSDSHRLARIFRPVLLATVAGATVLAVLDGALIILTAWYGEPAITGYRHPFVALAAGLAVAVGVVGMVRGYLKSSQWAHEVFGEAVSRSDEPQLWGLVEAVAAAIGTQPPDNIVLGLTPEMFVTQSDIRTLSSRLRGRTLYISLPLTRMLDQDELRAIIGHELGHFYGSDLEMSAGFYPIYGRAIHTLRAMSGVSRSDIVASVTLASTIGTLRYFLASLASAERAIARDRELLADQAGTHVSSPQAMASALVKVTTYTPLCERLLRSISPIAAGSGSVESAGDQLSRAAGIAENELGAGALDRVQLPHPTDTHPPLGVRLKALGTTAQAVISGGLAVKNGPATDLIPDASTRDSSLTTRLAQAMRKKPAASATVLRPAATGDASIDSAWTQPSVNRVVEYLRVHRGGSLTWILLPRGRWVAVDDLLIEPRPGAPNFRILAAAPNGIPSERWQVVDLADPDSPSDAVLKTGTHLDLVGVVNRGITAATVDELVFSPANGTQAGRLVSVGVVGRSPVHLGLAGSLIVPPGDLLISDQRRKSELQDLIETALDEVDGLTDEVPDPSAAGAVS
jgi:Zn-dependent protease with chaperone function